MNIKSTTKSGTVFNVIGHGDTLEDFLDYVKQHIDEWTEYQVMWDLSALDFARIDSSSIRNLIRKGQEVSRKRSGMKTAFLVESDLGFGMMRMFQLIADQDIDIEFSVFRNSEDAICWLAI